MNTRPHLLFVVQTHILMITRFYENKISFALEKHPKGTCMSQYQLHNVLKVQPTLCQHGDLMLIFVPCHKHAFSLSSNYNIVGYHWAKSQASIS